MHTRFYSRHPYMALINFYIFRGFRRFVLKLVFLRRTPKNTVKHFVIVILHRVLNPSRNSVLPLPIRTQYVQFYLWVMSNFILWQSEMPCSELIFLQRKLLSVPIVKFSENINLLSIGKPFLLFYKFIVIIIKFMNYIILKFTFDYYLVVLYINSERFVTLRKFI